MVYRGHSFPFEELAAPPPDVEAVSVHSARAIFDPELVQRITFRWTRGMFQEPPGPEFSPKGIYVFAGDYELLLQMYRELRDRQGLGPA